MSEVFTPKTLAEALSIRAETGAIPFAGGTDLMIEYFIGSNTLIEFPKPVLLLGGVSELAGIRTDGALLEIGALTTFFDIIHDKTVPQVLRDSALGIAGPPIRNIATIGGNICNASPSADSLPALYTLDAVLVLQSLRGERRLPIAEFITGVGKTVLADDELLVRVLIPVKAYEFSSYRKIGTRRANALSKLAFCGLVVKENGKYMFRVAFCTMGTTITRSPQIEATFAADSMSDWKSCVGEIQAEYAKVLKPRDSARSTAHYRGRTAQNLLKDFFDRM